MGPQEAGQTQGGWNLPITYCIGIRINRGLCNMAIRILEFSNGGIKKLERFLPKNQHAQRKLLNFENSIIGHTIQKCKKMAGQNTFKILLLNDANMIGEH